MDTEDEPPNREIEISDTQAHLAIHAPGLRALADRVLEAQGVRHASISVALVDNATIHALNRQHLGHDWPTDVISFALSEPGEDALAGELVVSAEMAAQTARAGGFDPQAELALYLVHGLLHLCGYDDATPAGAQRMRQREAELLATEGLTNTFPLVGSGPGAGPEPGAGRVRRECAGWSV